MIYTFDPILKSLRLSLTWKLCISSFLLLGNLVNAQISFKEKALISGINHSYIIGQAAGGLSFIDFDGDGLDDLTFGTSKDEAIHFYRNTGNGFVRNPPLIDNLTEQKQILWADYDNDGDKDLFVCAKDDVNRLYNNQGDLTFVDVTESSSLPLHEFQTYNACWADFNRDGWLDLYVCERVQGDRPSNRNSLFYNNANGTFTDVSEETQTQAGGKPPFCSSAVDVNNDNWPDIYIANDREWGNTLFLNQNGEFFDDISESSCTNYEIDAMSIAIGDYNNDSWIDMYVSNSPAGNVLMKNNSGLLDSIHFSNEAENTGVSYNGTAWGSNFLDADNDGDLDLYVSGSDFGSGNISAAFYEQISSDSFSIVKEGFEGDTVISYANAIGDFNSDGYPDIAVMNFNSSKSFLFENQSTGSPFIKLKLQGVLSNKDGIGCFIKLYGSDNFQSFYTHSGVGFQAQNSLNHIFGLGNAEKFDSILVKWPSGHLDMLIDVSAFQELNLIEGSTTGNEIIVDEDIVILESDFPSNTNDFLNENTISISPNPADSRIQIEKNHNLSRIAIYDINGIKILNQRIEKNQLTQIKLEQFSNGLYFLIGYSEQGELIKQSFVVHH